MATYVNNVYVPRGFSRPTSRALQSLNWVPISSGMQTSLSIEALATYLAGVDAVTYSPDRLASMTVNDMRYAQNIILGFQQ